MNSKRVSLPHRDHCNYLPIPFLVEDLAEFYPAEGLEDDDEDNPRKATKLFAGITFVVTGCKRAKKSLSEINDVVSRNGGKTAIFEQVGVKKTVRSGLVLL